VSAALPLVVCAPMHGPAVVALIQAIFDEYGMTFDLANFDRDLADIDAHYHARGGTFAVLLDGDDVVGTVAAIGSGDECEIKRLYLDAAYRGRGHGRQLLQHIVDWAAQQGFRRVTAWSDVRLTASHPVYERLGFQRMGERVVDDIDRSAELGFTRDLPER
jgi:putative acetyltransferase